MSDDDRPRCLHRTMSVERDPRTGEPVRVKCLGTGCAEVWKVVAHTMKQGVLI